MRCSIPCIVLLVVWSAASPASAQTWERLDPQPQSNTLMTVDFPDADHGWAGGANGTILHTTDGGSTWEAQNSGTSLIIYNIGFADAENGWAICGNWNGWGGAILHTTDAGATWVTEVSNTYYSFVRPLAVRSPLECWTATGYCDLMHTVSGVDSGGGWTAKDICATEGWPSLSWIYGLSFPDAYHGWIVGGGAWGPNAILHTNDGGASWSPQTAPTTGEFSGIVSVDAQHSWIWGAGTFWDPSGGFVIHTTDGGSTWMLQQFDEPYNLWELSFTDINTGWGVGTGGTIVHTTDGGDTWILEQADTTLDLYGLCFSDEQHGWAVGAGGVMLRHNPGSSGVSGSVVPLRFVLAQNYPNAFNLRTTMRFDLPVAGPVRISIYDVAGHLVCTLVDADLPAGSHEAVWDGRDPAGRSLASGIYIARLLAGGRESTVKMSLVR